MSSKRKGHEDHSTMADVDIMWYEKEYNGPFPKCIVLIKLLRPRN